MSPGTGRYLVLAMRNPGFDPGVIPAHHAHLERLRGSGALELAGPFADRSGGAYLLRAPDLASAIALAHADPLHATGASRLSVHEWNAA